jgi:hypothetical protein
MKRQLRKVKIDGPLRQTSSAYTTICGLLVCTRVWRNVDPGYRVGGGSARGSEYFFVTYFRKALPISQIALTKKLGSSDVRQTPNLCIYEVYDSAKSD